MTKLVLVRVTLVVLLRMFGMEIPALCIVTMDPAMMISPMPWHPDIFVTEILVNRAFVIWPVADGNRDPNLTLDWTEEHSQ